MTRGTRDERAAYTYYARSRRANGNEPVDFGRWIDMVGAVQVQEMVRLKCVVPWKPDCVLGYSVKLLKNLMEASLFKKFSEWVAGQGEPLCTGRVWNGAKKGYETSGCGPHWQVVHVADVDKFMGWPS